MPLALLLYQLCSRQKFNRSAFCRIEIQLWGKLHLFTFCLFYYLCHHQFIFGSSTPPARNHIILHDTKHLQLLCKSVSSIASGSEGPIRLVYWPQKNPIGAPAVAHVELSSWPLLLQLPWMGWQGEGRQWGWTCESVLHFFLLLTCCYFIVGFCVFML